MNWLTPTPFEKRRPIVLQPHQKYIKRHIHAIPFPFYIYWGMGSGKTIGGCVCMQCLSDGDTCLVLCDKSTVEQWIAEIRRFFGCNAQDFRQIKAFVQHYEALDDEKGANPKDFSMVIVDEAHRFRNAWDKQSRRMLSWMQRIHACQRVVFMSGTPIVHDADIEIPALQRMLLTDNFNGRFSHYDPRADQKRAHHYATTEDSVVECPMTWAQCFRYLLHRRQTFSLHLEGEEAPRSRLSSSRNTYNTMLRSICNCPYPDTPELSPKMMIIVQNLTKNESRKQVVYSSRRDTGVTALLELWRKRTMNKKAVFRIDGSMTQLERADHICRFNRGNVGVLFITDAGGQGIDLKRVNDMHIMEPSDNMQEERQIVNRAVRFKAHREKNSTVAVYRYVATFPISGRVEPPWKTELYKSGLFDVAELSGITRRVQYALKHLIRDEEYGLTIDERTIQIRDNREMRIQSALKDIQKHALEHTLADAVAVATDAEGTS